MKNWVLLAGVLGVFGTFVGCGEKDHPPVDASGSPMGGKAFGTAGSKQTGGEDAETGGAGGDSGSGDFEVVITAPNAADDPVVDDVIVAGDVTVLCEVRPGESGELPNPSTVTIEVFDAAGEPAVGFDDKPLSAPGVPTGEDDEYSAEFGLGSVATGAVSFRCSVKGQDTSLSGSATLDTFVDHGPTIVEKLPEMDSAHPLEGVLAVEFTVTPTLLSDDDSEAGVTGVALYVAGVKIDAVAEDPDSPGTYRASVDFTDGNLFEEPPTEHTSVRVEATNARTPDGALGVRDYPFVVDGLGPTITFSDPKPRAVFGETVVEFTIEDSGAGLDEDTLEILVSGYLGDDGEPGNPVKFNPANSNIWTQQGNRFEFRFDTGALEDIESQITVNVRASDAAGNLGESQSLLLNLDNVPPWIDLDPGDVRGVDGQDTCSASFDPLGDALDDGQIVKVRNNRLRALVYDQTTFGSGAHVSYMAGTDQKSARIYIQPDASQPLLIDRSLDGVCDDLAREDFKFLGMSAVPKAGQLTYSATDFATSPTIDPTNTSSPNYCKTKPVGTPPKTLCEEISDMSAVVEHDTKVQAGEPIVYGIGNLPPAECTGTHWDIGLVVELDGWICLAVRATDNLGNTGVSRPLRVCFDDPTVPGSPSCASGTEVPPSCTDNCTAPPAFPPAFFDF